MSALRPFFDLGLAVADRSCNTLGGGGGAAASFLAGGSAGFVGIH
jgi:hypothetical protein